MNKGVVLELKKDYAVVGCKGRYYRLQLKEQMEIGQEILFTIEDVLEIKTTRNRQSRLKFIPIFLVLCLALVMSYSYYDRNMAVFAFVTVDINPSVELMINSNREVIDAVAMNDDALTLSIDETIGLSITDAIEQILLKAKTEGYLNDDIDNYVAVTTVATKRMKTDDRQELKVVIDEAMKVVSNEQKINVALGESTENLLNEAISEGKPLSVVRFKDKIDVGSIESVKDLLSNVENQALFESEGSIIKVEIEIEDGQVEIEIEAENDDDGPRHDYDDLQELLFKLQQVPLAEVEIHEFIGRTETALLTDSADISALKEEAKLLWESVKDQYDIDDDDYDDFNDDAYDDDSDDQSDHDMNDLRELLFKLSQVPTSETEIHEFVIATQEALDDGTDNISQLKSQAKMMWESVKDQYDVSDDDYDDSSDDSSDDASHDLNDLKELLFKLKQVPTSETEIHEFVIATQEALDDGTGDVSQLKSQAKSLWESVKDQYDVSDDGYDDSSDDSSDDFSDDSSDDAYDDDLDDLLELLEKMEKEGSNDSTLMDFVSSTRKALSDGVADVSQLKDQAKELWEEFKDRDDD